MKYDIVTLYAVALRFLLGWFMFFAGIEKVLDPSFTASGFLLTAKMFPAFYAWFALPMNSWWVDPLNAWGITLIGVALLLGVGIRPAAWAGAALMIIYYFPHYTLPWIPHGFIVEEHIIYAVAFLLIAAMPQAYAFSASKYLRRTILGSIPVVKDFI
jgi:thiosulfate dehydrogenase [quinone] large subunit